MDDAAAPGCGQGSHLRQPVGLRRGQGPVPQASCRSGVRRPARAVERSRPARRRRRQYRHSRTGRGRPDPGGQHAAGAASRPSRARSTSSASGPEQPPRITGRSYGMLAQMFIHEIIHLRHHEGYRRPAPSSHRAGAEHSERRGHRPAHGGRVAPCSGAPRRGRGATPGRVLRIVDGEVLRFGKVKGAEWPAIDIDRYPSHAEAMRLVRQVGIRNLYSAYFERPDGYDHSVRSRARRAACLPPAGPARFAPPWHPRSPRPGGHPVAGSMIAGPGGIFLPRRMSSGEVRPGSRPGRGRFRPNCPARTQPGTFDPWRPSGPRGLTPRLPPLPPATRLA